MKNEKAGLTYENLYNWYAGKYFEFEYCGTEYVAIRNTELDDNGCPYMTAEAISKEDILNAMEEENTYVPIYDVIYYVPEKNTFQDDVGCYYFCERTLSEYDEFFDEQKPDDVSWSGLKMRIA